MRQNPLFNFIMTSRSISKFNNAVNQFETEVKHSNNLIEKIYSFFDANDEVYLNATDQERNEIREATSKLYYPAPQSGIVHYMGYYMEELLFGYVRKHVIDKLETTGDDIWLTRGLIAISIENCGSDWRDTWTMLGDLYKAAETKGINPEPAFLKIAELSSRGTPRGGTTPMNEMMAETEWFKNKEE